VNSIREVSICAAPVISTARGDEAADLVVRQELRTAARTVCQRKLNFTTDDITDIAGLSPREPRVLGAVMLWAQKQGYCVPTGNYRQSRNRECHKRPKMIWQSQIVEGLE